MTSERQHACSQAQCKVGETGSCLEGFTPEECSHHQWNLEEQAEGDATDAQLGGEGPDAAEAEVAETLVRDLHHGDALTLSEASVISVSGPSRLIVLAGDRDSGKTTVITSLYEQFLGGPFCNLQFAGSLTLPGFEQRAFHARMDSGRERADTPRTPTPAGLKVLHLCLVAEDSDPRRLHMLFGDLSGEWYRLSRESLADASELQFLRHTDRLCLLVNGEKLASPRERLGEIDEVQGTLRSLLEAQVLGSQSRIDVVCSKWDLVHGNDAAVGFLEHEFDEIRAAFEDDVRELHFDRIAARPAQVTTAVPHGFGLDVLLERWVSPEPRMRRIENPLPMTQPGERECARFARRYPLRKPS